MKKRRRLIPAVLLTACAVSMIFILGTWRIKAHMRERSLELLGIASEMKNGSGKDILDEYLSDTENDVYKEKGKQFLADNGYGMTGEEFLKELLAEPGAVGSAVIAFGMIFSGLFLYLYSYEKKLGETEELFEKKEEENGELKSQIRILQEEAVRLRMFTENVYHQMKTPLTNMQLYLEMMKEAQDASQKRKVDICLKQTIKISELTTVLLKEGKLAAHQVKLAYRMNALDELLEECMERLKPVMYEKHTDAVVVHKEQCSLLSDGVWLQEALVNILKNCAEHTGKGGRIEIGLYDRGRSREIIISDNGAGIGKETLVHLFERFYTSGESRSGFGIGLYLANEVVKMHMGELTVKNKEEGGTVFSIVLPVLSGKEVYER